MSEDSPLVVPAFLLAAAGVTQSMLDRVWPSRKLDFRPESAAFLRAETRLPAAA
jgi:hypothetical protein